MLPKEDSHTLKTSKPVVPAVLLLGKFHHLHLEVVCPIN
jgi:hypothetical protein